MEGTVFVVGLGELHAIDHPIFLATIAFIPATEIFQEGYPPR